MTLRHCPTCNSGRPDALCWKCGASTTEVDPAWTYPELPDVNMIRKLARAVGYAIGEHGSKERDLDLIAVPWTEDAVGNYELMQHIATGMNARIAVIERKPQGRYAATLQVNGWYKPIDLSVVSKVGDDAMTIIARLVHALKLRAPEHSALVAANKYIDAYISGVPNSR